MKVVETLKEIWFLCHIPDTEWLYYHGDITNTDTRNHIKTLSLWTCITTRWQMIIIKDLGH